MSDFLKVHHIVADPNTGEVKLTRVSPYMKIKGDGPMPLFLKSGNVYDENGVMQDPVPSWVWGAAAKCSDAALREVGFDPEAVRNPDQEKKVAKPKHWQRPAKKAAEAETQAAE